MGTILIYFQSVLNSIKMIHKKQERATVHTSATQLKDYEDCEESSSSQSGQRPDVALH